MAWPLPDAPVKKLIPPVTKIDEFDEEFLQDSIRYGYEPAKVPYHFNLNAPMAKDTEAPDPARSLQMILAAAAPSQKKPILREVLWSKLIPLIPQDEHVRNVYANNLMREDNDFIIECILKPSQRTLSQVLQHLHPVSRAEAAEQLAKDTEARSASVQVNAEARSTNIPRVGANI